MSRLLSDIPQYQREDPTWGIERCSECGEFEGDNVIDNRALCDFCSWDEINTVTEQEKTMTENKPDCEYFKPLPRSPWLCAWWDAGATENGVKHFCSRPNPPDREDPFCPTFGQLPSLSVKKRLAAQCPTSGQRNRGTYEVGDDGECD